MLQVMPIFNAAKIVFTESYSFRNGQRSVPSGRWMFRWKWSEHSVPYSNRSLFEDRFVTGQSRCWHRDKTAPPLHHQDWQSEA